jgi:hypothetical protein
MFCRRVSCHNFLPVRVIERCYCTSFELYCTLKTFDPSQNLVAVQCSRWHLIQKRMLTNRLRDNSNLNAKFVHFQELAARTIQVD